MSEFVLENTGKVEGTHQGRIRSWGCQCDDPAGTCTDSGDPRLSRNPNGERPLCRKNLDERFVDQRRIEVVGNFFENTFHIIGNERSDPRGLLGVETNNEMFGFVAGESLQRVQ